MTKAEHILTKLSQAAPPDPTVAKPAAAPATPGSGAAPVPPVQKPPVGAGKVQAPPAAKPVGNTSATKNVSVQGTTKRTQTDGPGGPTDTFKQTSQQTDLDTGEKTTYNKKEQNNIASTEFSNNKGSEKMMRGYKGNIFDPKGDKTLSLRTDEAGKETATYGNRKILPGRAKRMMNR